MYLVLPYATSVDDAVATVLHEVVGHKGLRQLFGEHFDTFLDNVFKNADVSIRKRVIELAKKIKDRVHRAVIGAITIRQQKDFQRIGLNISEDWVHSFENSRAINEDGHISQEKRVDQIPVTEKDLPLIPDILETTTQLTSRLIKTKWVTKW